MSKDLPEVNANSTTPNGDAQRIPAWKRLGLKLKFSKDAAEDPKPSLENGLPTTNLHQPKPKRVHAEATSSDVPAVSEQPATKKQRTTTSEIDNQSHKEATDRSSSALKREASNSRKRVSFTAETKKEDGDTAISIIPSELGRSNRVRERTDQSSDQSPKKTKKSKKAKAQQKSQKKVHTALQYIEIYQNSHDSWKFNKNKETWIFKHLFSLEDIPSDYDRALSSYLRGLKGESAKQRLIQRANEELSKVGEEIQSAREGQPDSVGKGRSMDDPEARKSFREDAARRYKRNYEAYLDALEDAEEEQGPQQEKRIAKRRRAEVVLWAVDIDRATEETGTTIQSRSQGTSSEKRALSVSSTSTPPITNGVRKKRKNRTLTVEVIEDSSSSDSDDSSDDSDVEASISTENTSRKTPTNGVSDEASSSETSSDDSSGASDDSSDSESTNSVSTRSVHTISTGTSHSGSSTTRSMTEGASTTSSSSDESDSDSSASSNDDDAESSSDDETESNNE